jgi:spoIIIJ-associated protein
MCTLRAIHGRDSMTEDLRQVEATGETVGEAKWAALRELEKLHPGLDKSAVRFQVVSEGERGLLGVGYAPARVIASVDSESVAAMSSPNEAESELAAEVRELIERITAGIGVRCRIDIVEDDETMTASCSGSNLGLLIGKHGQTIDAIQYLVNAIVWRARPDDRKDVVVDAAGYRERRRAALESLAVRSAEEALATHSPVELEPMTAVERKTVHVRLKEFDGVETGSEGTEPNRYVVISPAAQRPVRASGPVEGVSGEPGVSPGG